MAEEEKSYSEKNKQKIERMLEKNNVGAVRAVVANTIETKKIASKLPIIDIIFNSARQQVGYKVHMESFNEILGLFQEADDVLTKIIERATALGIYTPKTNKVSFSKAKEKLKEMVKNGASTEDIAREFQIELEKAKAWTKLVTSIAEKTS